MVHRHRTVSFRIMALLHLAPHSLLYYLSSTLLEARFSNLAAKLILIVLDISSKCMATYWWLEYCLPQHRGIKPRRCIAC